MENPDKSAAVFSHLPGGVFILTAQHESLRAAVLVKWVQQCSDQPPMVMVALPKGTAVEPLIHNTRSFALSQVSATDRFLLRKFATSDLPPDDPLVSLMVRSAPSGSPIIDRAMTCMDCEVVRHVELDCDFRIYVGQVHYSAVLNEGIPAICLGGNGVINSNGH